MFLAWSRPWHTRRKPPAGLRQRRTEPARGLRARPQVEVLEDRTLLSFATAVDFSPGTTTPTLTLRGPDRVLVGAPYTLELAASDLGTDRITQWTITWGDGTVETVAGNPSAVTHVYTKGPKVRKITATATDLAGPLSAANTVHVLVLAPRIVHADSRTVEPGQRVTFRVDGIESTVASSPNARDEINVLEADYRDDPAQQETDGVAFYDLQVDSADDETTLTATFQFPAGAANPTLKFFDEATQTYRTVGGSTRIRNSLVIDRVGNVIQVTFDRASFPSIRNLDGTVFTIAVPNSTPEAADVLPALASAATSDPSTGLTDSSAGNGLVRTTTFVSTNQLTLTLSASQDSQLTASRAVLGGGGERLLEPPAAREHPDALWVHWLMELFQDMPLWWQRLRNVQGSRQALNEQPATEANDLTEEEVMSQAGNPAWSDGIGDLLAQALSDDPRQAAPGDPAPWPAEAAVPVGDVADRADWCWALAASLVSLAYRERAARAEQPGVLLPEPTRLAAKNE